MQDFQQLRALKEEIKGYAREYGLDFFETIFEVVNYQQMNMVAAYGGFPNRYPHWRFGMEYERLSKSYSYGLHRIYEMVINNDPSYAYLLASNNLVDQKLVMAHVYAHVDYFKNNMWFSHTNRKMMDEMGNHATKIRRTIEKHGGTEVEQFLDVCLSLENLIDTHSPYIRRHPKPETAASGAGAALDHGAAGAPLSGKDGAYGEEEEEDVREVAKLRVERRYMDPFINPPEFIEEQLKEIREQKKKGKSFPEQPERDVLLFLMEHAPLKGWERDVLGIVREEAYYFAPQGMTKIQNEGWASFWHSKIMTTRALRDSEIIDYADHHSGTMGTRPGRLNPYKLGLELYRNIEERWNRGQFGRQWEQCDDLAERSRWDLRLGLGREKIFQVRQLYNDVTFIDEFLTPEFCKEQKLFSFGMNEETKNWEILSREFHEVKKKLLFSLTNFGQPVLFVTDANYLNRGELMLEQRHEGVDLQIDRAQDTLKNVYRIWRRPVHVRTQLDGAPVVLSFDGRDHKMKR